ncbi:MAG TPA: response regulator [Chitinophagaceae bacterium]
MNFNSNHTADNSIVKILIVDDREDNLFSLESILERDGYKIVKANSGRAALKVLLSEWDFSLILMDVQMPEMNGFETATLIYEREKLKHIPIIFITAHHYGEEQAYEGYKMGGVDYIYKPIDPDLLRYKVSVFAELYRKNFQLMQQEKKLIAVNRNLQKEIEDRKLSEQKIKKLNFQLLENNEQLKNTVEELDRFAYVASHDLQEPLRKILIFSDKLEQGYKASFPPEAAGYLEKIVRSSERMHQLINDLLKFSRYTNDNYGFEKTDLNQVLKDVISDIETDIQQKKAHIEIGQLPTIWAIPSQMRQVFQNLLSNSLKFSRDGVNPEIKIFGKKSSGSEINGANRKMANDQYFQIFFKDNGIGFDPRYAREIFVVFKRLHSYHEFEGTGIGLSICKKIIEKHNGFITAESSLNEGATFTITLPERIKLEEVTQQQQQPVEQPAANPVTEQ